MKPPCQYCPDRFIACHDTCARYQEYKEFRQRISDARAKSNLITDYYSDLSKRVEKIRRQHA